jgi:hypothetical protein
VQVRYLCKPLLEVYSTCVSWKFIGDSSPAASLEGARRPSKGLARRILLYGRRVRPELSPRRCYANLAAYRITRRVFGALGSLPTF